MNHLNSIYQRLQSNYSDCDITYAPGLLTVKCKTVKSGQTVFVPAFSKMERPYRSFWKKR